MLGLIRSISSLHIYIRDTVPLHLLHHYVPRQGCAPFGQVDLPLLGLAPGLARSGGAGPGADRVLCGSDGPAGRCFPIFFADYPPNEQGGPSYLVYVYGDPVSEQRITNPLPPP